MYPLLLLSLLAGVIIVERFIAFAQLGNVAPGLLQRVIRLCEQNSYEEALRDCQQHPGPVAASLAIVLQHRHQPVIRIERWVEETGQEYFIRLERLLPFLDTTTTISPLMGLLGTIVGMIGAFNAISAQQGKGNNDAVLHGVSEALYATACGIVIAVVCFIAYNYFATRLRSISATTEMAATKLLNVLSENHAAEAVATGAASAQNTPTNLRRSASLPAAGAQEDSHAVQATART